MQVLSILSPAKSLDFESELATDKFSHPQLLADSEELVNNLKAKSPDQIADLMGISDSLAELNFDRFNEWQPKFDPSNSRQAILAFDGDVYTGMQAPQTFDAADFSYSQETLRVLSGLYGVLRPLDLMMPYRLEMGTKLKTDRGNNLYNFWGEKITESLNEAISQSPGETVLINLASNEYFKSVKESLIVGEVVAPVFLDAKDVTDEAGNTVKGDYKVVSFFAKKARGALAGWLIKHRVDTVEGVKDFNALGYKYSKTHSTAKTPTFIRRNKK